MFISDYARMCCVVFGESQMYSSFLDRKHVKTTNIRRYQTIISSCVCVHSICALKSYRDDVFPVKAFRRIDLTSLSFANQYRLLN